MIVQLLLAREAEPMSHRVAHDENAWLGRSQIADTLLALPSEAMAWSERRDVEDVDVMREAVVHASGKLAAHQGQHKTDGDGEELTLDHR